MTKEQQIEESLIAKLKNLKYSYRQDIRNKDSLNGIPVVQIELKTLQVSPRCAMQQISPALGEVNG